jgi:hypothetical protein
MSVAELKAALIAAGWTYVLSITRTPGHGTEYGLLFTKDGEKFYLNHETLGSMPV